MYCFTGVGINPGTQWVGMGGLLLNKIYINVNSFFLVLFHVGGVEGTLYGYNTLNDMYVESVETNKYNCTSSTCVGGVKGTQ